MKFLFQGPPRFIGIGLTFCAVLGVVLLVFIWYGSYSDGLNADANPALWQHVGMLVRHWLQQPLDEQVIDVEIRVNAGQMTNQ